MTVVVKPDAGDATFRRELTLALLLLESWQEGHDGGRRAWKGYDFGILDDLDAAGLVSSRRGTKSLWITKAGEAQARRLVELFAAARRADR